MTSSITQEPGSWPIQEGLSQQEKPKGSDLHANKLAQAILGGVSAETKRPFHALCNGTLKKWPGKNSGVRVLLALRRAFDASFEKADFFSCDHVLKSFLSILKQNLSATRGTPSYLNQLFSLEEVREALLPEFIEQVIHVMPRILSEESFDKNLAFPSLSADPWKATFTSLFEAGKAPSSQEVSSFLLSLKAFLQGSEVSLFEEENLSLLRKRALSEEEKQLLQERISKALSSLDTLLACVSIEPIEQVLQALSPLLSKKVAYASEEDLKFFLEQAQQLLVVEPEIGWQKWQSQFIENYGSRNFSWCDNEVKSLLLKYIEFLAIAESGCAYVPLEQEQKERVSLALLSAESLLPSSPADETTLKTLISYFPHISATTTSVIGSSAAIAFLAGLPFVAMAAIGAAAGTVTQATLKWRHKKSVKNTSLQLNQWQEERRATREETSKAKREERVLQARKMP